MNKQVILLVFTLWFSVSAFAHRGEFASIEHVKIEETPDSYIYDFDFENIKQILLTDVRIELVINSHPVPMQYIKIDTIKPEQKFVHGRFQVSKADFNIEKDVVQIEIVSIFGKWKDWGGWDSPNFHENKQSNTLYSEFYADAPWRMKKLDNNGNVQSIPVHFFLHDADKVTGITLQIDYINIRLKNPSDASFGPVLTYNSMNDANFKALFSCKSPADGGMDIQEFKLNSFSKSNQYTMDFDESSDLFGDNFVKAEHRYWYFTFNIPAADLQGLGDIVDIEVKIGYANFSVSDDYIGLRVFRSSEDIPTLPNYYRGDTHLHSFFTQNNAEIGFPIEATIEAGKLIGLDWFTSTDHTSDYDNYGGGNVNTNWTRIQDQVRQLNTVNSDFKVVAGQEVSTNNAKGDLVHMLAYPSYDAPFSLPFLGDGNGDLTSTNKFIDDIVFGLKNADGFSYAAHPFATADKLPTVPVGGGIWNLGEIGFPDNSGTFPKTGGNIICNDVNSPSDLLAGNDTVLMKDRIQGAQIWNVRDGRQTTSTLTGDLDPWSVRGMETPFSITDTASYSHHFKRFRQGQEIVNHVNKIGLYNKNANDNYQHWKCYLGAGADAHGSFNFSNTDDFGNFGSINTNAVGKLTTIAYCPEGMGADGEHILKALYDGHTSISDGPIVVTGVSNDGNNTTNEILMGDDAIVNTLELNNYYFNLDAVTTQEFGDYTYLKLIAGTENGEIEKDIPLPSTNGTIHLSYPIQAILDTLFGEGNTPQKKYFYIRSEIQTHKEYTSELAFETPFDEFHSLSNPIWMKLDEVIPEEPVTEFSLDVYPNPFKGNIQLTIKNPTEDPVNVKLYNNLGQLVSSYLFTVNGIQVVTINTEKLKLAKGVYTVKASVQDYKDSKRILKAD